MTHTVWVSDQPLPAPNAWRILVIAMGTLILCSCRATDPYAINEGRFEQAVPCPALPSPCGACEGPWGRPADEYLCDGGDNGVPVAYTKNDDVAGLDAADTVVHFQTRDGDVQVVPSNRTCVYAPRFAATRQVVQAMSDEGLVRTRHVDDRDVAVASRDASEAGAVIHPLAPNRDIGTKLNQTLQQNERGYGVDDVDMLEELSERLLPFENMEIVRTGLLEDHQLPHLIQSAAAANVWSAVEAVQVVIENLPAHLEVGVRNPQVVDHYELPPGNPRMRICKLASEKAAHPGETVHFTIRFDNVGDERLDEVVILDNLVTRLEYVDGSQECTVEADFSVDPNAEESLRLRWALQAGLEPGEGGVIRFECRVR